MSGSVLWCSRCGVFGDKKAKGLKNGCKGKPPKQRHRGGMEGQLRKLRNGIHPKTGEDLPPAVELDPVFVSFRTNDQAEHSTLPDGFYHYVPENLRPCAPAEVAGAMSSTERRLALLDRIRAKELASKQARGIVISDDLRHPATCSYIGDHSSSIHHASGSTGDALTEGIDCGDDAGSRGLGAGGDMKQIEPMVSHGGDEAGEQHGEGIALTPTCTSSVKKCKGKYRITMKGAACHGKACCGGII